MDLIEFRYIPNNTHLHKNLSMYIPSLDKEILLDSYYFWNGNYFNDSDKIMINEISNHLLKCINVIISLKPNEVKFMPIDFSDEYYDCFKVQLSSENIYKLEYVTIDKSDTTGVIANEGNIELYDNNKQFSIEFSLLMNKKDVENSFRLQTVPHMRD
jgi:hypothetical protein